jgi:hypothetical protein
MPTAAEKPEVDERPEWAFGSEVMPTGAAHHGAARTGVLASLSAPFEAVADWRDSRRMRRSLRRGASSGVSAAATVTGARELIYRIEDWRVDQRARRYERSTRDGRRRIPVAALAVATLAVVALVAAWTMGGGSSSTARNASAAAVAPAPVANHTAGTPPAVSLSAARKHEALVAARARRLAAMRKQRAAALHRKRVAALKARRRAAAGARHSAPAAPAAAKAPSTTTPSPVVRQPVYHAPVRSAPKPAPKAKPKSGGGGSFDIGG